MLKCNIKNCLHINEDSFCSLYVNDAVDLGDQQVDGNQVVAAFGNDDVGIALAGFDELFMHRPYRIKILADDIVDFAASFLDIADQTADKAHIGIGINEDLDIEKAADVFIFENEQTFQDQHVAGIARFRHIAAGVVDKVICRLLHCFPC